MGKSKKKDKSKSEEPETRSAPDLPSEEDLKSLRTFLSVIYVPPFATSRSVYVVGIRPKTTEEEFLGATISEDDFITVKNFRLLECNIDLGYDCKAGVIEFEDYDSCAEFKNKEEKIYKGWEYRVLDYVPPEELDADLNGHLLGGKVFWHGYSKDGIPTLYVIPKIHDPSKMKTECIEDYVSFLTGSHRGFYPEPRREQIRVIVDFTGLGMKNFDSAQVKAIIKVAERTLLDVLEGLYFVNTPMVFWALWKVVKRLLSPELVAKVTIMGKDHQSKLKEMYDEDMLPTIVGGNGETEPDNWIYKMDPPPALTEGS